MISVIATSSANKSNFVKYSFILLWIDFSKTLLNDDKREMVQYLFILLGSILVGKGVIRASLFFGENNHLVLSISSFKFL